MTRISTIESALKGAYYDNYRNTDAMARAVVKQTGAEPSMDLFYEIEKLIVRHVVTEGHDNWRKLAEEIAAMLPEADADGWIQWSGGECPVPPDTVVEVRFGSGVAMTPRPARDHWWGHSNGTYGNIIAYRIVKPAPAPTIHVTPEASAKLLGISPKLYSPEYTELCRARDAARLAYDLICQRIEAFEERAEQKQREGGE